MLLDEVKVWGWLPIAVPLLVFCAHRLARWFLPTAPRATHLAATCVLAMAWVQVSVGLLGEVGLLSRSALLGSLFLLTSALLLWTRDASPREASWWLAVRSAPWAVLAVVATLAAAAFAARLLPVWHWDSQGYHLPYVNFVLQSGGFADVPPDLRYITTYPHNIELGMIWLRAMLPDDRLVDLAQVPYGLAGAVLTMATTRTALEPVTSVSARARRALSLLSGAAWLTLPVVFLQLPTNYVDVGTAATLLGALFFLVLTPSSPRSLLLGGLALGLFLGSKPSAPGATVVVLGIALVRAWRAGQLGALAGATAVTAVFGAQQYLVNFVRHGNPVWPVAVHLGPVTLPGTHEVSELLAAGAALPAASGGLLARLSVSWLALDAAPGFDMKLGGLGALPLLLLPLALLTLVRRRDLAFGLALGVALLSPDPSLSRYVLAFPALLLALGLAELARWPRPAMAGATVVVLGVMGWHLARSFPALTGEGPPLERYLSMRDDERRMAVGPHGQPTDYPQVWHRIARGESAAFDLDFEFPGLLWAPDLSYPVYSLKLHSTADELTDFLATHRVRVVAVGPHHAELLERTGGWDRLFECRSARCAVYGARPAVSRR
jgi:hypothetical protein